jgi:hypothetical protein
MKAKDLCAYIDVGFYRLFSWLSGMAIAGRPASNSIFW